MKRGSFFTFFTSGGCSPEAETSEDSWKWSKASVKDNVLPGVQGHQVGLQHWELFNLSVAFYLFVRLVKYKTSEGTENADRNGM